MQYTVHQHGQLCSYLHREQLRVVQEKNKASAYQHIHAPPTFYVLYCERTSCEVQRFNTIPLGRPPGVQQISQQNTTNAPKNDFFIAPVVAESFTIDRIPKYHAERVTNPPPRNGKTALSTSQIRLESQSIRPKLPTRSHTIPITEPSWR